MARTCRVPELQLRRGSGEHPAAPCLCSIKVKSGMFQSKGSLQRNILSMGTPNGQPRHRPWLRASEESRHLRSLIQADTKASYSLKRTGLPSAGTRKKGVVVLRKAHNPGVSAPYIPHILHVMPIKLRFWHRHLLRCPWLWLQPARLTYHGRLRPSRQVHI